MSLQGSVVMVTLYCYISFAVHPRNHQTSGGVKVLKLLRGSIYFWYVFQK